MKSDLEHRQNTAGPQHVEAHLAVCDPAFIPPLRARVDVSDYSAKIAARAHLFEAWSSGALVGLVAAYIEAGSARAFVTNVSVLPSWTGRGVASALLRRCIDHARSVGVEEIALEVDVRNASAICLYERIGFRRTGGDALQVAMTLKLADKT
jgi:ribosomal protein S18 acetylase RimI-like enzyme